MRKSPLSFLYIFLLFASMTACENCKLLPFDTGLHFVIENQTSQTISWYIPSSENQLSDVGLPNHRPELINKIPSGEIFGEWLRSTRDTNYFDNIPEDTLHIFVLSTETYENKDWEKIVEENDILQRVKLTKDSLEVLNYLVVIQ